MIASSRRRLLGAMSVGSLGLVTGGLVTGGLVAGGLAAGRQARADSPQDVEAMAAEHGIHYLRTTRGETPVIYDADEDFAVGGCKVLRQSGEDAATVIGCGVTTHEALGAYEALAGDGVRIRVIDLYSIKPLDEETLRQAARETPLLITVEDHYLEGGIGDAVCSALAETDARVYKIGVVGVPHSGPPDALLARA